VKQTLADAFYPEEVPNDYVRTAVSEWLKHKHLRAFLEDEWSLNASLKELSKRYAEIHVPVVIVTGDKDKIVSAKENAYRLKAIIPQSQLVELRGAGHEIPQAHPESIDRAVGLISTSGALAGLPQ
jgi:pimeloyl-ACP methyl ester carboxylesterase